MFLRNESFKEFLRFYPIVSGLVALHLVLWILIDLLQLDFARALESWGVGVNALVLNGEYWRLVTPIFLHNGLGHAFFNSFSLVLFGPALERMLGKVKFSITYLFAGIIANLGAFLVNPDAFYVHLGASGAIFGIFGVYVYMVLKRKDLIDQANSQIIMVIFILGLVMTFRPGIHILGHLFGLVGGFAIAPIVLRNAGTYSLWQLRAKYSRTYDDDEIRFNPNRWQNKKRFGGGNGKNIFWGVIIFLVVIAIFGRYL
ncbi:rhomboid family intramembrane serine protease [Halobacillus litoralis]|uniref:rhomboid family intramembrane serine protease n=1 Tax=Halobacillus litoralis TaxID=45668 RepID=UPI001CD3FC47|nr:rhomboid family intramembrane serine protease [Halobacillus litoralis]MCA0972798.1 rhomboid family intramembrane serine protease [Halobacillus litoralis]